MTKCWQPVSRPNAGRPSVVPPAGDCPPDICMFCPRTAAKLHSTHRPGLMVTLTSGQLQRCSRTLQHAAPRHSVTKYISTAPYCTKYNHCTAQTESAKCAARHRTLSVWMLSPNLEAGAGGCNPDLKYLLPRPRHSSLLQCLPSPAVMWPRTKYGNLVH